MEAYTTIPVLGRRRQKGHHELKTDLCMLCYTKVSSTNSVLRGGKQQLEGQKKQRANDFCCHVRRTGQ